MQNQSESNSNNNPNPASNGFARFAVKIAVRLAILVITGGILDIDLD